MGCGTSKSTRVVTPALQTGKSDKVDRSSGQNAVDSQTGSKAKATFDRVDKGRTHVGVADDIPTISVSTKELPLCKPVESSSESYLGDSGSTEEGNKSKGRELKEMDRVQVEETRKVFVTQAGSFTEDTSTKGGPPNEKIESQGVQLERSRVETKNVEERKSKEVEDSNAIPLGYSDKRAEEIQTKEQMQLEDSRTIPPEPCHDPEGTTKKRSETRNPEVVDIGTSHMGTPERKESIMQGNEVNLPSFESDNSKYITENVSGSPRGVTPTSQNVITKNIKNSERIGKNLVERQPSGSQEQQIIKSSNNIQKELVEQQSSGLQDIHAVKSEAMRDSFERVVVEEDMVCESVDNACIDFVADKTVPMEISSDRIIAMETLATKEKVVSKDHVTADEIIHVVQPTQIDASVAMPTDHDNRKEVATIRIEVDDEFEPDFTAKQSVEKNKGLVNYSSDENHRSPTTGTSSGHKRSVSKVPVCLENRSTTSSSLLPPDTTRGAAAGKNLDEMESTRSFAKSPSWSSAEKSKIEKLVNEGLDVHPSLRNVSPALGFTRSMVAACLDEVDEEGEGEKEPDNGDQGGCF